MKDAKTQGNVPQKGHALLAASKADRWVNCTPSARIEDMFPDTTSSYAQEGTHAHAIGEIELRYLRNKLTPEDYKKGMDLLRDNPLYNPEMDDEVLKYTNYVEEQFRASQRVTKDSLLLIEDRIDLSHFIPEGYGTGDAIIIADGRMEIIDLKYGKGVKVSAKNNSQLRLYGLGALRAYELMYDIKTVRVTVVQPRLDHIDSEDLSADQLHIWAESVIVPKALLAFEGKGTAVAGAWCHFCKASARCKVLAEKSMESARHDFKEANLLTDEELIGVFEASPGLVNWCNSVKDYMLSQALEGKEWPGYKLVEGRSNRTWIDEEQALFILKAKKFKEQDYLNSKIKGIGDIEKLIGKDKFPDAFKNCVAKPQGKPTLVEVSDKRPALGVEQAREDFK